MSEPYVLVVDDEVEIAELVAEEIKVKGMSAIVCSNGKDALEKIQANNPKVIVSDYNMPGLDGLELLRFIGDLKLKIPVIWITGHADQKIYKEAWRMGVHEFITKPFDVTEVADHVKVAFDLKPESMFERRPKFMNDKHFKHLEIDMEIELFNKLKNQCLKDNISMSRFITSLLAHILNEE